MFIRISYLQKCDNNYFNCKPFHCHYYSLKFQLQPRIAKMWIFTAKNYKIIIFQMKNLYWKITVRRIVRYLPFSHVLVGKIASSFGYLICPISYGHLLTYSYWKSLRKWGHFEKAKITLKILPACWTANVHCEGV